MKKAIIWFIGFFIMQKVATATCLIISFVQMMIDYKITNFQYLWDYLINVYIYNAEPVISYFGYMLGRVGIYILYIALIYFVYREPINAKLKAMVANYKLVLRKITIYVLILGGFCLGILVIDYFLFPSLVENSGNNQNFINNLIEQKMYLFVFINLVIISPIVEEFTFRYILMRKLLSKVPRLLRMAIAIFVFSFIHIGFTQAISSPTLFIHLMFTYVPAATVFVYCYEREGNIIYPLALHMLNNLASIFFVIATMNI